MYAGMFRDINPNELWVDLKRDYSPFLMIPPPITSSPS